ncbi:hypothetical protein SUGI_0473070 [Cryptomeria japonica]|uniref:histone-lysine N-methyltransferase ASHH1 isoform X2 n=1 Tax=Cryptomeria japonica TaxID=3369 RepID=UPI0024089A47|nr:histone-lysine N-methyltransferase ASHH1 isoform X2 [Cryptomeria japonica]GLJ24747.1 hypothetical protein SUGI_0473070 [Cryptomeria japonica]
MGKILQQDKPRRPNTGPRSARRGSRRSKQPLTVPASNNSEIPLQEQAAEAPPFYIHIECNGFLHRGHKKQKEEDIPVCVCKYIPDDSESMCGERCLNVLTSTECTPGHCPCGDHCKNQRFQNCEYVKSKLFKTDGRGWGLMADQDIKAGQFIIEYCGEVISCKEARRRSQAYEAAGLRDAFIISLDRFESIDATRKGSFARFINHSCEPNCETRKWTVLGEIRVGIFAKQDIHCGTELAYDYNFEWYGGAKVRCRCGAPSCYGFLGAKSRGFQNDAYLWEDNDERYSVENVPLYDSDEDEPLSNFLKRAKVCKKLKIAATKQHNTSQVASSIQTNGMDPILLTAPDQKDDKSSDVSAIKDKSTLLDLAEIAIWDEKQEMGIVDLDQKAPALEREGTIKCTPEATEADNKSKHLISKRVNADFISQILPSKEARDELLAAQETKIAKAAELNSFYDRIRPAIQDHGKDGQDSVPTSFAEEWIKVSCEHLKAQFDVHFKVVKHMSDNVCDLKNGDLNLEGDKSKLF